MVYQKNITITHPTMGNFVSETFVDDVQFKLFLQMIHACIELDKDLTYFNGKSLLVHIPTKVLKECVVLGKSTDVTLSEYAIGKLSQIEA